MRRFSTKRHSRIILALTFGLICANESYSQLAGGAFTDVKLVPKINDSIGWDLFPFISSDGLELYFSRGFFGDHVNDPSDIWITRRDSMNEEFGEPVKLDAPINSDSGDTSARLSEGGLEMYFNSRRINGDHDIFVATRNSKHDGWDSPLPLANVNSDFDDMDPYVSSDGMELYFESTRPGSGNRDLYRASRSSLKEDFDNVTALTNLNTENDDTAPSISSDGLFLFFSDWVDAPGVRPDGVGNVDAWFSRRNSTDEPFESIANVGEPISSGGSDSNITVPPDWPADGSVVYFGSNRPSDVGNGPVGWSNIWQATWHLNPESFADFNLDEHKNAMDIELLGDAMGQNPHPKYRRFDLDGSGAVDAKDLTRLIEVELNTWFGDANLDGVFDSADLVALFQAGEFEDNVAGNSTWSTGDWNQDDEFDSADFVKAFQDGGFEQGPRDAVSAVPEPSNAILLAIGVLSLCRFQDAERHTPRPRRIGRLGDRPREFNRL